MAQQLSLEPVQDTKLDLEPLQLEEIKTAPNESPKDNTGLGSKFWNYIQSTTPVKFANEFITKHADELAQQKPGILNPNPDENPLINKPLLPEWQKSQGLSDLIAPGTSKHGLMENVTHGVYDYLIRPMSSPLGILGGILDANPPTEPIGLPKEIKPNVPEPLPKLVEPLPKIEPKLLGPAPNHIENPPRFISGAAGIADTTTPYKMDVGPIGKDTGELGTVLPREMGEVVPIKPEFAAEHGTELGTPLRGDVTLDDHLALGRLQRNAPERAMVEAQHAMGGGVMNPLIEHVGDLTHRMNDSNTIRTAGYEYVKDKVDKSLRWLTNPYGFEKEFGENLINNSSYKGIDINEYQNKVFSALDKYAAEHAKLPAYNEAQVLARDAAVAVGKRDFPTAISNLKQLQTHLGSADEWNNYAREGIVDTKNKFNLGRPDLPYQTPTAEKTARLFGSTYEKNKLAQNVAKATNEVHSPELDAAVSDPSFVKKFIPNEDDVMTVKPSRTNPYSRTAANLGSSIDTELAKQNPHLGNLVKQTQVDSHIQAGTWVQQFENIIKGINKSEESKLVDAIEGRIQLDPLEDKKLIPMLNGYRALNQEVSDAAINSGMGLKTADGTKLIPWQPRDNYWPHMYPEEVLNQLNSSTGRLNARAAMMAEGKAPLEIDAILSNSRRFGERLIDAQHGRETDLPGYRKDMNVYKKHLTDMAKRITESINYGPMDLADSESPLTTLVNESRNPEYASGLVKKLLGRDFTDQATRDASYVTRKLTAAQAWLHLTTSGISNLNTVAMIPIQNNVSSFIKGLSDYALNNAQTGEFAESAGALSNIFREIFADGIKNHSFSPTAVYGLDAGERFMRTISAATGRAYAKELFEALKNNPNNAQAGRTLQNLILERPEKVLLQNTLTENQIKRAAFRASELSQGIAENQNLPKSWTGSGIANLLTLFHKYQFTQTKAIKDLVLSNPTRAIPLLLGASQIAGELTGDTKAAITGGINQALGNDKGISDTVGERGKFWESRLGVDAVTARVIENAVQSFALGTYGDALELMSGNGSDALKQLMGSTLNDTAKVFDILKNTATGNTDKASQGVLKMIPTIGRPLAEVVK